MNADLLISLAGRSAQGLLVWSWQAAVLVTCVWFGLKVCRVRSPALRHQIWLFSLVAVAILPSASAVGRRFPVISPSRSNLSYVVEAPRMLIDLAPQSTQTGSSAPLKSQAKPARPSDSLTSSAWPLMSAVWLIGSLVVLAGLMKEQLSLRRARKLAQPITARDLNIPEQPALLTGKVGLRLSSRFESPVLCGIVRPIILLPADIVEWTSSEERSAMLQHELAHVERLDPFVNLFQLALRVVFFFHPAVRYACRQLSLERELACDERVVALGANAETYAEGLLKVAERGLAPSPGYQLAFFSAKHILERRINMILNSDRIRAGARQWKFMVLAACLIASVTWFLIPAGSAQSGPAQSPDNSSASKLRAVEKLGELKAYNELIEMALRNTDPELRRLAAVRLTELEGDGSTQAMVDLYSQTSESEVQTMLIDTFARISEIEPLTRIASSDPSDENRQRALRRIKFLKEKSESADVRNWDVSALTDQLKQVSAEPPPPTPPPPASDAPATTGLTPPPPPVPPRPAVSRPAKELPPPPAPPQKP